MVTYFFRQLLFKKTSRNALLLSFLITLQVPAAYAGGKSEEEKEGRDRDRDRDRASESSQELPPSQGSYRSYLAPAATALSALAAIIYGRGLNIIGLLRSTQPARAVAAEVGKGVDVSTQSEGVGGEGAPMDGPEPRRGESRASTRERFLRERHLKTERDEARRQCDEARRQRDEARRQCDELTGERDTIQDECEGLRSSQLALQQQIRQLEQELLEKISQLAARGDCIDYLAEELGEDAELLRALRLEVQQGHEALARSGEALDQTRRIATEKIEAGQRELAEIQQKLQAARDALVKADAAVVQCKAVRAAGRGQRSGLGAGRGRPPLAQQGARDCRSGTTGGRGGHGPADALRRSAVLLGGGSASVVAPPPSRAYLEPCVVHSERSTAAATRPGRAPTAATSLSLPAVPTPGLSQPPNTDQQGQQALVERQAIHLLLAAVQSRVASSGSGGDASGRGGASCYVAAEAPEDPSCERWAVLARLAAFQEQQDSPGNTPACECAHAAVECILNPATPTESIAASPDVAGDIRPAGAASDPNPPTSDDELFH